MASPDITLRRTMMAALWFAVLGSAGASAQDGGPGLPAKSSFVGEVHRGADGAIEIFDPAKAKGSGPRICDEGTICVGPDQAFTSIAEAANEAREGDTIEIAGGTYHETAWIKLDRVAIRAIKGRPHIDCSGLALSGDKACLLITGNDDTVEGLEISGAQLPPSLGENGACIRNGHDTNFTVRDVICHGSQNGILSDGGTIVVENSEFYDNGWTGQTHNVYFSGDCRSLTVRHTTFRDARIGHEFKSRCASTKITDSTFRSTRGSRDLDLPDGGNTLIEHSVLEKTAGAQNHEIIGFAAESCNLPGDVVLRDVKIVNSSPHASIHNFGKCDGHSIVLDHVTIEGMPVDREGDVSVR